MSSENIKPYYFQNFWNFQIIYKSFRAFVTLNNLLPVIKLNKTLSLRDSHSLKISWTSTRNKFRNQINNLSALIQSHSKVFSRKLFWRVLKQSPRRCSVKKGVLRNFTYFTGKHLCQDLFFNKVAGGLQLC